MILKHQQLGLSIQSPPISRKNHTVYLNLLLMFPISGNMADINCLKSLRLLKQNNFLMQGWSLNRRKCGAGWGRVISRCHKLRGNQKLEWWVPQLMLWLPSEKGVPRLLGACKEDKTESSQGGSLDCEHSLNAILLSKTPPHMRGVLRDTYPQAQAVERKLICSRHWMKRKVSQRI